MAQPRLRILSKSLFFRPIRSSAAVDPTRPFAPSKSPRVVHTPLSSFTALMENSRPQFSPSRSLASSTRRSRNRLGIPLLCAEISFVAILAVIASLSINSFRTLRQTAPTTTAMRNNRSGDSHQGCPIGPPIRAISSGTIPKTSFTAVEWSSSNFSPIPSFQQDIQNFGPSALLDEDTTFSCFAFAGGQGGAVLVSNSEEYHITHFTLNNSAVGVSTGSNYHPKEGTLWGLFEGALPFDLVNAITSFVAKDMIYVLLGDFCFDPEHGLIQTFSVDADIIASPTIKFSAFYLGVLSNWGGSHTCVCRLTFHGYP